MAEERAPITVEDTPYVITGIEDDGGGGLVTILNDGEREPLDPDSLEIGAENVLYTKVKAGKYSARFLRPAYYHLSRQFEADDSDHYFIRLGAARYPLRTATPGRRE